MDFTIPLLALSSLFLLNKNKGTSSGTTNIVDGKYKPKSQPIFKNELDDILTELEPKLEIEDLRDFLMGVAWVESKYFPSAVAYPSITDERWADIKKLYKTNKYIKNKVLWEYTGGLFQLFPSSALKTSDGTGLKNDPTTVFNPYYAVAYAIDFASRLEKLGANTWFDIRLGWASLKTLNEKPPDYVLEIEGRIIKGINASDGDVEILYKYVPNRFDKYRADYGFQKTLKYIQSIKIG